MSSVAPVTPSKPRRRWLRGIFLLGAMLVGTFVLTWLIAEITMRSAWDDAIAEADALDPRWRLEDILEDRAKIADDDNSAPTIKIIADAVVKARLCGVPKFMEHFEAQLPPPQYQWDAPRLAFLRSELAKVPKELEAARALKDKPNGRFPIVYPDDYYSGFEGGAASHVRRAGYLLSLDVHVRTHDGKFDQAVESCQAIVNVGRALRDEPLIELCGVHRIQIDLAIEMLERTLAHGEATDDSLIVLQKQLQQELADDSWRHAVGGLKGGHHQVYDGVRAGKLKPSIFWLPRNAGVIARIRAWSADRFPSGTLRHYPEQLVHLNRLTEINKLPWPERRTKMVAWEAESNSLDEPFPNIAKSIALHFQGEIRHQALLRSAIVAIACKRYRMKHQEWPKALQVLVDAKFLDALPTDPIDDQPLRFQTHPSGIVGDSGFRLWNVPSRRLPPVATPADFTFQKAGDG